MKEENEVKWEAGYRPNGQKYWETPFVNGKRHGIETWWYENGKKSSEYKYVNGQEHGIHFEWYDNGSLFCVENWNQGEFVVEFRFFEASKVPEGRVPEVDILSKEFKLL